MLGIAIVLVVLAACSVGGSDTLPSTTPAPSQATSGSVSPSPAPSPATSSPDPEVRPRFAAVGVCDPVSESTISFVGIDFTPGGQYKLIVRTNKQPVTDMKNTGTVDGAGHMLVEFSCKGRPTGEYTVTAVDLSGYVSADQDNFTIVPPPPS